MKEMRRITIIWGAFLFILMTALTIISILWKTKNDKYEDIEAKLRHAAEAKIESIDNYPEGLEVITYTYDELKNEEFITELGNEKDKCTGYVDIKYNEGLIFEPYIKCNKYKTKGYIE